MKTSGLMLPASPSHAPTAFQRPCRNARQASVTGTERKSDICPNQSVLDSAALLRMSAAVTQVTSGDQPGRSVRMTIAADTQPAARLASCHMSRAGHRSTRASGSTRR